MQATFRCLSENASLQVTNNVFFDMIRTHIHLARIQIGPRRTMQGQEVLFTTNERTFSLNPMAEQKFAPRQNSLKPWGVISVWVSNILPPVLTIWLSFCALFCWQPVFGGSSFWYPASHWGTA